MLLLSLQLQSPQNILKIVCTAQQHIVIPIPQDPIAFSFQRESPLIVVSSPLQMLTAIQLHDQPQLIAQEVGNVSTYRSLPSEFETI